MTQMTLDPDRKRWFVVGTLRYAKALESAAKKAEAVGAEDTALAFRARAEWAVTDFAKRIGTDRLTVDAVELKVGRTILQYARAALEDARASAGEIRHLDEAKRVGEELTSLEAAIDEWQEQLDAFTEAAQRVSVTVERGSPPEGVDASTGEVVEGGA